MMFLCLFFRVDSVMLLEDGFEVVSSDASDKMLKTAYKLRWDRRRETAFDNWSRWTNLFLGRSVSIDFKGSMEPMNFGKIALHSKHFNCNHYCIGSITFPKFVFTRSLCYLLHIYNLNLAILNFANPILPSKKIAKLEGLLDSSIINVIPERDGK